MYLPYRVYELQIEYATYNKITFYTEFTSIVICFNLISLKPGFEIIVLYLSPMMNSTIHEL